MQSVTSDEDVTYVYLDMKQPHVRNDCVLYTVKSRTVYTYRAGATGTAGTAMAVPKQKKTKTKSGRGTSKTGEKKFRCMILYRESPRVQDLPPKFQTNSGGRPPDPLKHGPSAAPLRGSCLRP